MHHFIYQERISAGNFLQKIIEHSYSQTKLDDIITKYDFSLNLNLSCFKISPNYVFMDMLHTKITSIISRIQLYLTRPLLFNLLSKWAIAYNMISYDIMVGVLLCRPVTFTPRAPFTYNWNVSGSNEPNNNWTEKREADYHVSVEKLHWYKGEVLEVM